MARTEYRIHEIRISRERHDNNRFPVKRDEPVAIAYLEVGKSQRFAEIELTPVQLARIVEDGARALRLLIATAPGGSK